MSGFRPLTALAQESVGAVLESGALAIDATVGNGHDTLFLAARVAARGHVAGFDIQPQALDTTHARLEHAGLAGRVTLYPCGHQFMLQRIPGGWHGRVSAVMFNLGYLPGGDKQLITRTVTTMPALRQALAVLRPGGLLSLMVYRGHAGADDEARAVAEWVSGLDARYLVARHRSPGPLLYLITPQH
jgi:SAM-dependent methyltransferase